MSYSVALGGALGLPCAADLIHCRAPSSLSYLPLALHRISQVLGTRHQLERALIRSPENLTAIGERVVAAAQVPAATTAKVIAIPSDMILRIEVSMNKAGRIVGTAVGRAKTRWLSPKPAGSGLITRS